MPFGIQFELCDFSYMKKIYCYIFNPYENYGSFCLTFQCAFCEKDKHCIAFDVVKDVTHKSCEGQDWKYKQCVGEQINIAKLLFYLQYKVT